MKKISTTRTLTVLFEILLFSNRVWTTNTWGNGYFRQTSPDANIYSELLKMSIHTTPHNEITGLSTLYKTIPDGYGVKIALVTGDVNYRSPSLKLLNYGYRFEGDDINGVTYKVETRSPATITSKHGTAMAGIIAGKQDSFRGVAYASELHIYNVFGNRNSTSTSLVLSALERAINSKVNVVVLPEIQQLDTHQEKLKQTIKYAATQGMIILVAATTKNLSDKKVYFSYHDSPVISVGGYAQSFQLAHWFEEEGTGKRISFISPCRQIDYNLGSKRVITLLKRSKIDADYRKIVKGNILLASASTHADIVALEKRAKRLNAGGIIILRNGVQQRNKMACTIPVFEVNAQHYKHIQDNRNDHLFVFAGRYGNIKDNELLRVYEKHTPNSIEWYLRPDILGPSTNVYTASIDSKKAYEFYSDINAALAYTAGVSALLLKYIKDSPTLRKHGMNVVTVKTILQNMAMPIIQPNTFIPLPLLYQGAGVLSVGKPIMKDLFIQPSFLKLKATQDTFIKRSIFIDALPNRHGYTFTWIPANPMLISSTGTRLLSPFDPIASLTVEFMPDEKLKLHSTGSLHVTFNIAHKIPNKSKLQYSGYIVITPNNPRYNNSPDSIVYIPYSGKIEMP